MLAWAHTRQRYAAAGRVWQAGAERHRDQRGLAKSMREPGTSEAPEWDVVFDADNYLHFCTQDFLTEAHTAQESAFVRQVTGLGPRSTVLDIACGHGRHALALAPFVDRVVGIDASMKFIELARESASQRGITNVDFVDADVRQASIDGPFNAALMLSTVFGLFSDSDTVALLRRIVLGLAATGKLCFDFVNRDAALIDFQAHHVLEMNGDFMLDRCAFDLRTGIITNRRVYIRKGVVTYAPFTFRFYNYSEVDALLAAAGLRVCEAYSDWAMRPLYNEARKIVIVAELK